MIPKSVLRYFNETWTKENRKTILKSLKITINKKYIRYKDNFVEEKVFEKKLRYMIRKILYLRSFHKLKLMSQNGITIYPYLLEDISMNFLKRNGKKIMQGCRLPIQLVSIH